MILKVVTVYYFDWKSFTDWVGVISAIGTVVAAALAAWAIRQAANQAKRNAELVVNERLKELQLDVLKELADITAEQIHNLAMNLQFQRQAYARLAMIDIALPYTRARYADNVSGNPPALPLDIPHAVDGQTIKGAFANDEMTNSGVQVRFRVMEELTSAIQAIAAQPAN
jgi:hypothetical protein